MNGKKPSPEIGKNPQKSKPGQKPPRQKAQTAEKEIGGFADSGLEEPTRFGDWEVKGRCSDF
jgi:hypothetical protein